MRRHRSPYVVAGMRKTDIETKCEQILHETIPSHLHTVGPLDVERFIDCYILEAYGVSLDIVESLPPGKEANTILKNKTIIFTATDWDALCRRSHRHRFTGCHESFHAIVHSKQLDTIAFSRDESNYKVFCDPEWQSDHAAGAFLMPRTTIYPFTKKLLQGGISETDLIEEVSNRYQASISSVRTRLSKLEIIQKEFPEWVTTENSFERTKFNWGA